MITSQEKYLEITAFMEDQYNVSSFFFDACLRYPEKIAIIETDEKISFASLKNDVLATADYFLEAGILPGHKVLLLVPMSITLYKNLLALLHIGATVVFVDEWAGFARLGACCSRVPCHALVAGWKINTLSFFSKELRKIPIKLKANIVYTSAKKIAEFKKTNVLSPALITFTTGSTGMPKAAIREHKHLYYQYMALRHEINAAEDDVFLSVLPIVLLINLATGSTSVIADWNSRKPQKMVQAKIFSQIVKHHINCIASSPFFVKQLALHLGEAKEIRENIEKIFTGGAVVFPSEAELLLKAFPKAKINVVYGSTEAEPISTITAEELVNESKIFSSNGAAVGAPVSRITVIILPITNNNIAFATDETLYANALQPGNAGEIVVSGKQVLEDYLFDKEAVLRNKIFTDTTCWHRTGDAGIMSENGRLYLQGRCAQMIYHKGETIAPFLMEYQLKQNSQVKMGTVFMIKEKVVAVIECSKKSDRIMLREEILKADKRINKVIFMTEIPRDPRHFSKINYIKLQKIVEGI